jgi:hypothetical protein
MSWSLGTIVLSAIAGGLLGGCNRGPELEPVEGRVIYRNGMPVYPGSIWFVPDSPGDDDGDLTPSEGSSSILDETGSFRLRTYPHGDGAPAGPYRATLSLGPGSSRELSKYAGPTTSPLRYVVPDGGLDDLVIELEADPARPGSSGPPNVGAGSGRRR